MTDSDEYYRKLTMALSTAAKWHDGKMVGSLLDEDEIIDLLFTHILEISEEMLALRNDLARQQKMHQQLITNLMRTHTVDKQTAPSADTGQDNG